MNAGCTYAILDNARSITDTHAQMLQRSPYSVKTAVSQKFAPSQRYGKIWISVCIVSNERGAQDPKLSCMMLASHTEP